MVGCVYYLNQVRVGDALKVSVANACDASGDCRDPVILLQGQIEARSAEKTFAIVLDLMASNPDVRTVCFVSEGGDVDASVAIGFLIRKNELNTCIASKYKLQNSSYIAGLCQSSCVWVSMSGTESLLYDKGALLGFHAAREQDFWGGIKGIDYAGFFKFMDLIKHSTFVTERRNRIYGLLAWSFDQGAQPKTTNCSAQQVQDYYPYFSKVKDLRTLNYQDCGLR